MVTVYGMNNKVGNISFYDPQQETSFTKPYSDETARMIDEEVRKLIDDAYEKTKDLLTLRKAEVEKLAQALLDREVLFQSDVEALIGKRPYEEKKPLAVDEVVTEPALGPSALSTDAAQEENKQGEQPGSAGCAPVA